MNKKTVFRTAHKTNKITFCLTNYSRSRQTKCVCRTLRSVCKTIFKVEKQSILHIPRVFCCLRYLACNAHALCCHLWHVWVYSIFPIYLTNGTIFDIYLSNMKCVFWFSLYLLFETFLILRRTQRDMIINVLRYTHVEQPLILTDFNKIWIFSTDF